MLVDSIQVFREWWLKAIGAAEGNPRDIGALPTGRTIRTPIPEAYTQSSGSDLTQRIASHPRD